jgi:hypothetical protein
MDEPDFDIERVAADHKTLACMILYYPCQVRGVLLQTWPGIDMLF